MILFDDMPMPQLYFQVIKIHMLIAFITQVHERIAVSWCFYRVYNQHTVAAIARRIYPVGCTALAYKIKSLIKKQYR